MDHKPEPRDPLVTLLLVQNRLDKRGETADAEKRWLGRFMTAKELP